MNPNITLPTSELKPALSGLGKLINSRASLLVLKTIKVERTSEGWICLTTTDLDRFATVRLEQPAKGEPMALLIPYEDLLKLTKASHKADEVIFEPSSGNTALIRFNLANQFGETKVPSLPVSEFPEIPRINGDPIPVPEKLRLALHEAMACVGTDNSRRTITGACIDVSLPKANYMVGTDGRHLYSSNSFSIPLKRSLIIPKHKFLGWKDFNLDGDWQLRVPDTSDHENKVFIQLSSRRWRFITRLIEGDFPNWRQTVPDPASAKTTLQFNPDSLDAVIQLVERMPDFDEQYHRIGIEYQGKEVCLLGKANATDPWTRVPLPGCKAQGKPVSVFLDRRYLIKALDFNLSNVAIIDDISPLRFHLGGKQMIVMPVRRLGSSDKPAPVHPGPPPQIQPLPTIERKSMLNTPPPTEAPPAVPTIDELLTDIHQTRETLLQGASKLRDVTLKLKLVHRGQRSSEREFKSVRNALQSLQTMRL